MRKCCSMRVSKSSACRLLMPSFLKKSSSGRSSSRGTLKCAAARPSTSSIVFSSVGIDHYFAILRASFTCASRQPGLWQIRQRVRALHKLAQTGFHGRPSEQCAEDVDFPPQVLVRYRLDELL